MTDNEKLARWQGKCYHVSDWGQTICKYCGRTNDPRYFDFDSINSDYLNDDAAAMSLLDTLTSKGYVWFLGLDTDEIGEIADIRCKVRYKDSTASINKYADTRRAAVVAAVLELIGKEDV